MKIIIRSVIILFSIFLVGSVSYAKKIQSCNVKRKQAPIVNISNAKKTCTTVSKKGVVPDGLGGIDSMYLISGRGNLYGLGGEINDQYACAYGHDTSSQWIRYYIPVTSGDPQYYKYIRGWKNKNYLTYYGGTMYAWLMVWEYLGEIKTKDGMRLKEGSQEYKVLGSDLASYKYIDGYLYGSGEFPVFVVDNTIYNPRDKSIGTKYLNYSNILSDESHQNYQGKNIKHGTYRGPRLYQGKTKEGKIIVARQENVKIIYDKNDIPLQTQMHLTLVNYDFTTCILQ